ncbi:MAG: hypothetical protein AABX59_02730 [Nanoarchaeota archaeon]
MESYDLHVYMAREEGEDGKRGYRGSYLGDERKNEGVVLYCKSLSNLRLFVKTAMEKFAKDGKSINLINSPRKREDGIPLSKDDFFVLEEILNNRGIAIVG